MFVVAFAIDCGFAKSVGKMAPIVRLAIELYSTIYYLYYFSMIANGLLLYIRYCGIAHIFQYLACNNSNLHAVQAGNLEAVMAGSLPSCL